jgi:signal peptidase
VTRRSLRPLVRGAGSIATVGLLIAWFLVLRPTSLGGPADYVVVRGDSMVPTYATGDLVIVRAESDYKPGDVVAYRVPVGELGAGLLVIHRIVGGGPDTGFVMEGDNNPAPDPWLPRAGDIAGRAWAVVPFVGRALSILHQPAIAASAAVALLVAVGFLRIGRNRTHRSGIGTLDACRTGSAGSDSDTASSSSVAASPG